MPQSVLIDAGPIVAYLRGGDQWHDWAVKQFDRFPHFITCDAVLAEACARLAYHGEDQSRVMELVTTGAIRPEFQSGPAATRIVRLMRKYADQPMDLADACLVVMTEHIEDSLVVTRRAGFPRLPAEWPRSDPPRDTGAVNRARGA
jgi:predicted nucleic acid-binding protein